MTGESKNPFADDPVEIGDESDNPYGAATDTAYNPVYEVTLYPRTRMIVSMATISFVLAFIAETFWWTTFSVFTIPLTIISLIFGVSAIWSGNRDLAAMQSGVMPADKRSLIRTSVLAAMLALGFVALRIVYSVVSNL